MKTVKSICLAVLAAVLLLACSCMLTPAATEGIVRRAGYFETDPDTHKPLIDYDMSEKVLSAADVKTISGIFRKYKLKNEVLDLACTHDLTIGNTKYRYQDTEGYVECGHGSFFLSGEDNEIIKNITDRYSLKNSPAVLDRNEIDPEEVIE